MEKIYEIIRNYIYIHLPELYIRLHLLHMWIEGADKYQRWLDKGDFYLNKGVRLQIGQPVKFRTKSKNKTLFIKGIYYDFKKRKITALYSHKPIPGVSDPFITNEKNR